MNIKQFYNLPLQLFKLLLPRVIQISSWIIRTLFCSLFSCLIFHLFIYRAVRLIFFSPCPCYLRNRKKCVCHALSYSSRQGNVRFFFLHLEYFNRNILLNKKKEERTECSKENLHEFDTWERRKKQACRSMFIVQEESMPNLFTLCRFSRIVSCSCEINSMVCERRRRCWRRKKNNNVVVMNNFFICYRAPYFYWYIYGWRFCCDASKSTQFSFE